MNKHDEGWFIFSVEDTGGVGVELPRLVRLLSNLSGAFYTIAREKIGIASARPGPRTAAEDALASVRLVRITPGSAVLEVAPPEQALQATLEFAPNPDDVAYEFFREAQSIGAGEPSTAANSLIRRQVRAVLDDASEIGSRAEIKFRPRTPRPEFKAHILLRTVIETRSMASETAAQPTHRTRRVTGHAYMVDVEPGRQRLRIKLTEGRDLTIDVDDDIPSSLVASALDQPVQLDVNEEVQGGSPSRRSVRDLTILPSPQSQETRPPKTIAELLREQRIPKKRPDYVALASEIWTNQSELDEFDEYLRGSRRVGND